MEKLIYTKKLEEQLKTQTWTVENGIFVKKNKHTSNIETINIIDKNLNKLKQEYYSIVCYLYESVIDGKIKAYGSPYYGDYQDFQNLYKNPYIDKRKILNEVVEAIFGLEKIGINYIDIHARNIIVKDNHMRLVDLDEALPLIYKEKKANLLLSLIIESMLLYDVREETWDYLEPIKMLYSLDSLNLLSKQFINAINKGIDDSLFLTKVDEFITELLDEERNNIIRKELRLKYPRHYTKKKKGIELIWIKELVQNTFFFYIIEFLTLFD